jgi:oligopeptide transport system ATP-binding protein
VSDRVLLSVRDLRTWFETEEGTLKAVDGVSFELVRGETLGIVGESGSGKSVTSLSIIRLVPEPPGRIVSGEIVFDGTDILRLSPKEIRDIRGRRISMIFQDPMTSLNPFMPVSKQLMEMTRLHLGHSKSEAREHAIRMLEAVGIPDARSRANSYPHEFSGGMRQRVMIAMALALDPEILIADEPTTALDVTVQAQIMELLKDLQRQTGMGLVLITHDLGVVNEVADRVAVMYAGKIVETGMIDEVFTNPAHPYTEGLMSSVPHAETKGTRLHPITGQPPNLAAIPSGCSFHPRCPRARFGDMALPGRECAHDVPPLREVLPGRESACHYSEELLDG